MLRINGDDLLYCNTLILKLSTPDPRVARSWDSYPREIASAIDESPKFIFLDERLLQLPGKLGSFLQSSQLHGYSVSATGLTRPQLDDSFNGPLEQPESQ